MLYTVPEIKNRAKAAELAGAFMAQRRAGYGRPHQDLLSWTILYRRYLKEGVLFDLPNHFFLKEIYELEAPRKVYMKAGQLGLSEFAVSWILWSADQRKATGLYVFPTDTAVSDFSTARIGPAIDVSPYLASIIVDGGGGKAGKSGADRVGLKRVGDRFIYFRGAKIDKDGKAPQLKSVDADVIVLDEVDEMDGRAPIIARKRLGHSRIAEELAISTPTYNGRGIHSMYLDSDQRRWHIKCDSCGRWQAPSLKHLVIEWDDLDRPMIWNGMGEDEPYLACEKCGAKLNRLKAGRWVPTYPSRDVLGYHLSKLFSWTGNLAQIIRSLSSVDETERRECFNQDLGLPYTPKGGKLTDEELDACLRPYGLGRQKNEKPFIGIDVGPLNTVIVRGAVQEDGTRPLRLAAEVESWNELGRIIREYNPSVVVIDGEPEVTKARELQAEFPDGLIWVADYPSNGLNDKDPVRWDRKNSRVLIDRTRLLDATYARFRMEENTLPGDGRSIPNYYNQLKAPTRVLKDGVVRYIEDSADHYAHAENYVTAASMRYRGLLW